MGSNRSGFRLTDLVVLVFVLFVLALLLLPAVNGPRPNSRRTQCINNMRQIAIALTNYETTHGCLPAYGTFARTADDLSMLDFENPRHSWVVSLLPYLERSEISDEWAHGSAIAATPGVVDTADPGYPNHDEGMNRSLEDVDNYRLSHMHLEILVCPDDSDAQDLYGALTYVANCGFMEPGVEHSWYRTMLDWDGDGEITDRDREYKRMTGLFWAGSLDGGSVEDHLTEFEEVSSGDGLTQTVLLTENLNAGFQPNLGRAAARDPGLEDDDITWAYPDVRAVGFGISTEEICGDGRLDCPEPYRSLQRSAINHEPGAHEGEAPYASSFHPGGVVMAMCDASTRFVSQEIDPQIWFALVTPRGGQLPLEPERGIFLRQEPIDHSDF